MTFFPPQGGTEEAVSAASCGARRGKKRKVSSAKDREAVSTGSLPQPEIRDELAVTTGPGQFMASTDRSNAAVLLARV